MTFQRLAGFALMAAGVCWFGYSIVIGEFAILLPLAVVITGATVAFPVWAEQFRSISATRADKRKKHGRAGWTFILAGLVFCAFYGFDFGVAAAGR